MVYRCTKHPRVWMHLMRLLLPNGKIWEFFKCPVPGCGQVKPHKWQEGSQRDQSQKFRTNRNIA